jgi:hypothetical protein
MLRHLLIVMAAVAMLIAGGCSDQGEPAPFVAPSEDEQTEAPQPEEQPTESEGAEPPSEAPEEPAPEEQPAAPEEEDEQAIPEGSWVHVGPPNDQALQPLKVLRFVGDEMFRFSLIPPDEQDRQRGRTWRILREGPFEVTRRNDALAWQGLWGQAHASYDRSGNVLVMPAVVQVERTVWRAMFTEYRRNDRGRAESRPVEYTWRCLADPFVQSTGAAEFPMPAEDEPGANQSYELSRRQGPDGGTILVLRFLAEAAEGGPAFEWCRLSWREGESIMFEGAPWYGLEIRRHVRPSALAEAHRQRLDRYLAEDLGRKVPAEAEAVASPQEFFTFRQLLEVPLIVVGEVSTDVPDAAAAPGAAFLRVREVLKGDVDEQLLALRSTGPALPDGAEGIFFLGRRDEQGRYLIDHPQRVYDLKHLVKVRMGVADPSRVDPGYYLRPADAAMADRARERSLRRLLVVAEPSGAVDGLALAVEPLKNELEIGRTLSVRFTLKNVSDQPLRVRDNSDVNYLVRLTRLDADNQPGRVVFLQQQTAGVGASLGGFATADEYYTIEPGQTRRRTLHFSALDHPALRYGGRYRIAGIYRTRGMDEAFGEPVWTGLLVSETQPLQIQGRNAPPLNGRLNTLAQ